MSEFIIDPDAPILVEFTTPPGVQQVTRGAAPTPTTLAEKSAEALDSAMSTIHNMAERVKALRNTLPVEFSQVELEFGIKLDAEAGAMIAKAGVEAAFNVKLTWERPADERAVT